MIKEKPSDRRRFAPLIGLVVGGCVIPVLLFVFCLVVLRDTGGPLFWPLIAVPMASIGLFVGFVYKWKDDPSDREQEGSQSEETE